MQEGMIKRSGSPAKAVIMDRYGREFGLDVANYYEPDELTPVGAITAAHVGEMVRFDPAPTDNGHVTKAIRWPEGSWEGLIP